MTDVVLLQGSTQSPAGFRRLVAALTRRGHRPVTTDLPSAAAPTADGYADLLVAGLPADLDRPVVVAHSASGLILPALAERLDAVRQVWLAAVVGDHRGQRSLMTELQADPPAVFNPEWLATGRGIDDVAATYFLFHDADWTTLREVLGTVSLCDLSALYAEVPTTDPAARPSTYLLPTGDRTLRPTWMAAAARERLGVEPVELPGGHNNFVAHAERVAQEIDRAARG